MTVDDAVAQIEDNMVLGIGTGSTIELLIQSSLKEFTRTIKYHCVLLIKCIYCKTRY